MVSYDTGYRMHERKLLDDSPPKIRTNASAAITNLRTCCQLDWRSCSTAEYLACVCWQAAFIRCSGTWVSAGGCLGTAFTFMYLGRDIELLPAGVWVDPSGVLVRGCSDSLSRRGQRRSILWWKINLCTFSSQHPAGNWPPTCSKSDWITQFITNTAIINYYRISCPWRRRSLSSSRRPVAPVDCQLFLYRHSS